MKTRRNKVIWALSIAFFLLVAFGFNGARDVVGPKASAWQKIKEIPLSGNIYALDWHPDGRHIAVTLDRHRAQVWDIEKNTGSDFIVSTRWGTNQSGREIGFSPDGNFLVIQDVKSTKPEDHPFPRTVNDPLEITARVDTEAYQLGRILLWPSLSEHRKIMGPASKMHSSQMSGFCWAGKNRTTFVVHRNAAVATYSFPEGKLLDEVSILYPYPQNIALDKSLWWSMTCHPEKLIVAVQGALINYIDRERLGLPKSGPTPVAIVDVDQKKLLKTLITHDGINGVLFTADGRYLVAHGFPPMQVWDANNGFADVPPVKEPNEKTGTMAAVGGDWVVGMANRMHIWRIGQQQVADQEQPVARYSWRTAYHAGSQTMAIAHGHMLTLYRLNTDAVTFDGKR